MNSYLVYMVNQLPGYPVCQLKYRLQVAGYELQVYKEK